MKKEFKILTPLEQLMEYLQGHSGSEVSFSSVEKELVMHFDYNDLIDLFTGPLQEKFKLDLIENISTSSFMTLQEKVFLSFSEGKKKNSELHYLCELLAFKLNFLVRVSFLDKSISKQFSISEKGDVNYFLNVLDQLIFQALFQINENLEKNKVTLANCFGLLFLDDKKTAVNRFVNFISKELYSGVGSSNHQNIIILKDTFFRYLNMNFVPNISYHNYKNGMELFISENAIITKKELEKIIGQEEYFQKEIPLFELSEYELFQINDDFPEDRLDYSKEILRSFFEFICEEKFIYKESNVFELFFSSCTQTYPSFSRDDLYYAHGLLNSIVASNKQVFNYIISIFIFLKNSDSIKLVPKKLPKILYTYFKGNSLSQTTINQYIIREEKNSKEFLADCNYINDWAISIQKNIL
ncbi:MULTISPECIES: hypothetical protein [unclassified Myroides]|uniref:hypothetical protein n=1 Tax=unclassified Myroides TaxID=2642485 RepID=UPI003100D491